MTDSILAYWFCRENMTSPNAPRIKWKVGQARALRGGDIIPCERGYHGSPSLWDAFHYIPGPVACLIRLSGDITPNGNPVDKYAARRKTLLAAVDVSRDLRLFVADCAEHVLWIYERNYPNDMRPRVAIQAARDYANGLITATALNAAGDAAWDAAWAAAGDAAWVAVGDAAWVAARAAAGVDERAWQRTQFEARFAHLFDGVSTDE